MKKYISLIWILLCLIPLKAKISAEHIAPGMRNYTILRVEFQTDNHPGTTGNGRFMIDAWTGHDTVYTVDPIPHDRAYFQSHLHFIDNYWNRVSEGRIRINTHSSRLLPPGSDAYQLNNEMRYYSRPDSLDYRLARLVYESIDAAVKAGEFITPDDGLIIYHAGVGQDFNIDLDDTPFDIPSFYFDENYLENYLPADQYDTLIALGCLQGIVLPETQNQLKRNIALNGTEILLTGMMLGLPTHYNTGTGRSGTGIFGLMDQGSNNAGGLSPIRPSAFERYLLGAAEPRLLDRSDLYTLRRNEVYRIPISSNEYFLLEFRKNTGVWADSLMWTRKDVKHHLDVLRVMDSLGVIEYTLENGVLTDISDDDMSLPASGLLIWHIVEPESFGENPNGGAIPFINLVEADGGDDIGKLYNTFDPSVNNGWKWDIWFKNNPAYADNNPYAYKMQFNENSNPRSHSAAGLPTGVNIRDFYFYSDSVVIRLELESPVAYHFDKLVFDEITRSLPPLFSSASAPLAFRDSSLFLFNEGDLVRIYTHTRDYPRYNTALLSLSDHSGIVQIINDGTNTEVVQLQYILPGTELSPVQTLYLDHEVDLKRVAISPDSLFLPPALPMEDPLSIVEIGTWTHDQITRSPVPVFPYVPFIADNPLQFTLANDAVFMNDTLVTARNNGFSYDQNSPMAEDHIIHSLIPMHLDDDGSFEVLALTEYKGKNTLSAFTHYGYLMNGFPVIGDYRDLRAYYLNGTAHILTYDPRGIVDVYNPSADLLFSLPAPVDAASLFMEQVSLDSAMLFIDGSIYYLRSDSVYWGYTGKDAAHSNAHQSNPEASAEVSVFLIRDKLIYNYPNPIENEITRFRYFANGAQNISIRIYQLSGRHIETLSHIPVNNQWNEIIWDVSGLESGVYIARIEASGMGRKEEYFIKPAILK